MANKYYVKIPYNYMKYGTLSAYVYADDESEAIDLAIDSENRYSEDYSDDDDSGDTSYEFSQMDIELEEEDVSPPHETHHNQQNSIFSRVPTYFLQEIN